MLEPLAVDPNRSVAPAANSIASARLVFPAPAGPTSAITRVPLDSPAMRLSFRAVAGARVALRGVRAPILKPPPSACFEPLARALVTASVVPVERSGASFGWDAHGEEAEAQI